MKKILIFLAAAGWLLSCQQQPATDTAAVSPAAQQTDGLFIHITQGYNDPHRVLMPLKMAVMMSQDKDVLVYLDIHAVALLVKDAKDLSMEGFESCHTYIRQLLDKGVGVYVCPTCLKVAGFTPDDLMEGVQVASKERFFDFTQGRILTLDY